MAAITLRSIKGSPLTIAEVDLNFSNLNIEVGQKLDTVSYTAADVLNKLKTVDTDDSGLNASTLKSLDVTPLNTTSTVVSRDASGNFAANNVTANLFIGNVTGNVSGTSANITGNLAIVNGGTGATSPSAALDNLLPSGEVAGYVLKTSGPGTYFWSLETGATTLVGTRINTSRVSYTATANQTVFTGIGQYTIGAGQLRVYINGVRQFPDAYSETSTTTFTLTNGVPVGTKVLAEVDAFINYDIIASAVSFSPTGSIASTNVQNAIAELDSEKAAVGQQFFLGTTQVAINRISGALTLSGVSIDGNAATATTATNATNATNATLSTNSTNAIGYNQTWQNVTSTRAYGTTYTNSTGKPIYVSVSGSSSVASGGGIQFYIAGVLVAQQGATQNASILSYHNITMLIPDGVTYRVTAIPGGGGQGGSNLAQWFELR